MLRIRLQIRFDLYFLWIGHLLPWELKGDKGRILLVEGAGQDLGNVLMGLMRLLPLHRACLRGVRSFLHLWARLDSCNESAYFVILFCTADIRRVIGLYSYDLVLLSELALNVFL